MHSNIIPKPKRRINYREMKLRKEEKKAPSIRDSHAVFHFKKIMISFRFLENIVSIFCKKLSNVTERKGEKKNESILNLQFLFTSGKKRKKSCTHHCD